MPNTGDSHPQDRRCQQVSWGKSRKAGTRPAGLAHGSVCKRFSIADSQLLCRSINYNTVQTDPDAGKFQPVLIILEGYVLMRAGFGVSGQQAKAEADLGSETSSCRVSAPPYHVPLCGSIPKYQWRLGAVGMLRHAHGRVERRRE